MSEPRRSVCKRDFEDIQKERKAGDMRREDTLTHGSLFSGIGGFELGAEEYYDIWKSKRSVKAYNELKKQTTIKFE